MSKSRLQRFVGSIDQPRMAYELSRRPPTQFLILSSNHRTARHRILHPSSPRAIRHRNSLLTHTKAGPFPNQTKSRPPNQTRKITRQRPASQERTQFQVHNNNNIHPNSTFRNRTQLPQKPQHQNGTTPPNPLRRRLQQKYELTRSRQRRRLRRQQQQNFLSYNHNPQIRRPDPRLQLRKAL